MPEPARTLGGENAVVSYDVRDLLDEIKREQIKGFARLEHALESKADLSATTALSAKVGVVEERVHELERERDRREAATAAHEKVRGERREWQRWLVPIILTVAWLVLAVLQLVHG